MLVPFLTASCGQYLISHSMLCFAVAYAVAIRRFIRWYYQLCPLGAIKITAGHSGLRVGSFVPNLTSPFALA